MVRETCNVDIKCTRLNNQFRCRNLCDIKQEGKLNPEQFALCMYLIHQKQAGKDPPAQLTPDMIPPSMRPKGAEAGAGQNRSVYNNPELEEMAKEIQALLQVKYLSYLSS